MFESGEFMTLLLGAWFERNTSQLCTLNQDTGQEIISWDKSTVEKALDSVLICSEDLNSNFLTRKAQN